MRGRFDCVQHGSHGGLRIVCVIGVPTAADIFRLVGLLQDLGDLRISFHMSEKTVHVDFTEFFRKGDLAVRRQFLISKE